MTFRVSTTFNKSMSPLLYRFLSYLTAGLCVLFVNRALGENYRSSSEPVKPDPSPVLPAKGLVPETLIQLGLGQYFSYHAFVMDKANRTLTVWKQDHDQLQFVLAVPADFGRNNGNKVGQGDLKTPEGIYFFQQSKDGAELDFEKYGKYEVKAFTLDYPNFFDNLDKKSGSGIWLHSLPDYLSLWRGSRGCIVVRNDVMAHLSQYITLKKTPILIQNSVQFVPQDKALQAKQNWQTWLNHWRESWEHKDLAPYLSFYSEKFKSLGMNKSKWGEFKKGLAEKYQYIKINLSEPIFLVHQKELIVRFLQDYRSDQNEDFGEKTLYLRRQEPNGDFKIINEEWRPLRRNSFVATH